MLSFLNFFAKKMDIKLTILTQISVINIGRKWVIGLQEKRQFFSPKIGENRQKIVIVPM
jgi:hypothetical protein